MSGRQRQLAGKDKGIWGNINRDSATQQGIADAIRDGSGKREYRIKVGDAYNCSKKRHKLEVSLITCHEICSVAAVVSCEI